MDIKELIKSGEQARLFPIVAETSKEKRVASIFLALLPKMPDLAASLFRSTGAKINTRTKIHCFTEIVLKTDNKPKIDRPDGLIIVESGKSTWSALIEFKIGRADLDTEQVERYLRLARDNNIDAVITVSNQFVTRADHPPVPVSKTLLRRVDLFHWPWMWVFTHCQLLQMEGIVEDEEQLFLLKEFVRFMDHHSTGISGFTQMNKGWRELVTAAGAGGVLSKTSDEVESTVAGWIEEQRDLCLQLSQLVGKTVRQVLPRKQLKDPDARLKSAISEFCETKDLNAVFSIPDTAGDLHVEADLVRKSVDVSMKLKAPENKISTKARVNWLLKMIKADDDRIFIRAHWPSKVSPTQAKLTDVRLNPDCLQPDNKDLSPHGFEVLLVNSLGGRFGGSRTFIEELEKIVPDFYTLIGQNLKAWQPAAPKPKERPLLVLGMAERVEEDLEE